MTRAQAVEWSHVDIRTSLSRNAAGLTVRSLHGSIIRPGSIIHPRFTVALGFGLHGVTQSSSHTCCQHKQQTQMPLFLCLCLLQIILDI